MLSAEPVDDLLTFMSFLAFIIANLVFKTTCRMGIVRMLRCRSVCCQAVFFSKTIESIT